MKIELYLQDSYLLIKTSIQQLLYRFIISMLTIIDILFSGTNKNYSIILREFILELVLCSCILQMSSNIFYIQDMQSL